MGFGSIFRDTGLGHPCIKICRTLVWVFFNKGLPTLCMQAVSAALCPLKVLLTHMTMAVTQTWRFLTVLNPVSNGKETTEKQQKNEQSLGASCV